MLRAAPYAPLLLLTLAACTKGDKVPSYVEIPAVTLATSGNEGSATSRITDAWVYADEELLGVWELPARVPVLKEGTTRISVTPGIKRNGMYDDRLRYPFYTTYNADVDLVRTESRTLQPVVNFIPQANHWIEAFQEPGTLLNVTESSDTTLLRFTPSANPELLFADGTACGGFRLDTDHRFIRLYTSENFEVNGGPIFLEFDYRTDIVLTVGVSLMANGSPVAAPYVYVSETRRSNGHMPWNHLYVDLSPVFNQGGVSSRNVYFEANLPTSRQSAEVYLDNIRLVRTIP